MGPAVHRFRAIDVLRGLTLAVMIVVNMQIGPGRSYPPLLHAAWNGLTPTDLVFPTFLFVVGTALSFTLEKYEALGNAAVMRKVATRTALRSCDPDLRRSPDDAAPLDVFLRSVRPEHAGHLPPRRGGTDSAPDYSHRPGKPV